MKFLHRVKAFAARLWSAEPVACIAVFHVAASVVAYLSVHLSPDQFGLLQAVETPLEAVLVRSKVSPS